jgi:hypothetical protein
VSAHRSSRPKRRRPAQPLGIAARRDIAAMAPISPADPPRRSLRRTFLRLTRRVAAVGAFALAAYAAFTFVLSPILGDAGERDAAPVVEAAPAPAEPPPRPEGLPARIPPWAWDLHEWHLTPETDRGPRPAAAPRRVPDWYWEWRAWRLQVAPPPSPATTG